MTSQILEVNPSSPDEAVVRRAAEVLRDGGVIAFPTDTLYGIACAFGENEAVDRIRQLRNIEAQKRPLTFVLADLGELPHYASVNDQGLHILERIFPGPYCAELLAGGKTLAPVAQKERQTIGVRVPDNVFCRRLLWTLERPILTATAKAKGITLTTAQQISEELGAGLDLIIDGGPLAGAPSTVVSLVDDWVAVVREGRGPTDKVLNG